MNNPLVLEILVVTLALGVLVLDLWSPPERRARIGLGAAGVLTARKVDVPVRTVFVGNPLVADVNVVDSRHVFVLGKNFGTTNLIALDRNGALLMEHPVQVQGPRESVVAVYRGIERESYSCTPDCNRRIMLCDSATYFTANMAQFTNLNTQAQASGMAPR